MAAHGSTPRPPPPPPPPSKHTAAADMKPPRAPPPPPPPPPPVSAAGSARPPEKRKLEEVGFHHSPYYKIRAAVANLRGRFLQVCQSTDPQNKEAALEILKEMKILMEISKETRLDISAAAEPVKPLDLPAIRATKNMLEVPSGEKYQVPQMDPAAIFLHNPGEKVPANPVSSHAAAKTLRVETQGEAKRTEIADHTYQLDERLRGSYIIGGSPIGWNFLMWPAGRSAYYGLTKQEWLARQAA